MNSDYIDRYGRFHTKRIDSDPEGMPTNNAYIYSFYAYCLGLYDTEDYWPYFLPNVKQIKTFSRHPEGSKVPISHDEYVGVAGMSRYHAEFIVGAGANSAHWQFCDLPGFEPKPFYKLNPIKVIKDFYALSKEVDDKGRSNSRKATVKYPYIWPICFWHRTTHQYFYYRCAKGRPGFLRTCSFIGSSLFSIFYDPETVMLGMKLIKLKQLGYTLPERFIAYMYKKHSDLLTAIRAEIPDYNCPILQKAEELAFRGVLNDKI